jgi:hypothetical protein
MAIKGKDLFQDDGALEKAIRDLEAMEKAYGKMSDRIKSDAKRLERDIKKVAGSSTEARKATREQAAAASALEKEQKKLSEAMGENAKRLAELREAKNEQNRLNRLTAKLNAAEEGSYQRLSAQYSINKIQLNKMSAEYRKTNKEGQKLEKQTREIYEQMKLLQEATGKHQLNVGNYKNSIRELADEMGNMPGVMGQVQGGVQGVSRAFRVLLANPIVAVLGLIVGTLGALFEGFRRSEGGAQMLARASGVLQGLLSGLSRIATVAVENIKAFAKDPIQGIKDLGASIGRNLLDRFNAYIKLVGLAGTALKQLVQRDLVGLKNTAEEAGDALLIAATGATADDWRDTAKGVNDLREEISKTANAFADLYARQREVRRENALLVSSIENLRTQQQLALQIQEDDTRGFRERTEAAKEARELTVQLAREELRVAQNNLSVLNQEIALREANNENVLNLLEERANAIREVANAERELTVGLEEGEELRRRLRQDAYERELDILIDGFDNTKTINEQKIADDSRTLEERRRILEETAQIGTDSFNQQIAVIQRFTDQKLDADALLAESDARRQFAMIRELELSEIIEGRLLEVIRDRKSAIQDLATAERELAQQAQERQAEVVAARVKEAEDAFQATKQGIEKEAEVRRSEIDAMQATEEEKTKLRLEAERERLKQILDLYEGSEDQIVEADKKIVMNQIQAITNELNAAGATATAGADRDLYDLLGIGISDDKKEVLNSAFDSAKQQLSEWMALRQQAADQAVQNADREVQAAQQALNAELKKAELGYAANVSRAEDELKLQQENQRQAIERQRRAQRESLAIQTAEQAANLITATTKILAQFPMPFALAPLALMWGSFAAAKVRAFQETQFAKGGFEEFNYGGSHASGNDIPLGFTPDGKMRKVERGESMAIFSKSSMGKYGNLLPGLTNAINSGNLEGFVSRMGTTKFHGMLNVAAGVDTSRMERELREIRRQGSEQIYTDSKGRMVIKRGNQRFIYE